MSQKNGFKTFYAVSFAWQLGFIIAVPMAGFMFLGFWLDKKIGVSPLFLIISSIAGLAISIRGVYHLIEPLLKIDNNEQDNKKSEEQNN